MTRRYQGIPVADQRDNFLSRVDCLRPPAEVLVSLFRELMAIQLARIEVDDPVLHGPVEHRLERVVDMELGPWRQIGRSQVFDHLTNVSRAHMPNRDATNRGKSVVPNALLL